MFFSAFLLYDSAAATTYRYCWRGGITRMRLAKHISGSESFRAGERRYGCCASTFMGGQISFSSLNCEAKQKKTSACDVNGRRLRWSRKSDLNIFFSSVNYSRRLVHWGSADLASLFTSYDSWYGTKVSHRGRLNIHIMIIYSWFLFMSSQTINFRVIAMIKVMLNSIRADFGFEISSLLSMCSLLRYQSIPHNILNWVRMQSTELEEIPINIHIVPSRKQLRRED